MGTVGQPPWPGPRPRKQLRLDCGCSGPLQLEPQAVPRLPIGAHIPIPVLARLAKVVLLEPWQVAVGQPAVTPAQLGGALHAAELCMRPLQAALDGGAAPAQPPHAPGRCADMTAPVVQLLAQLRGTCEHQPGWDEAAVRLGSEAALTTAHAAVQLAATMVQRWDRASELLEAGAPALLRELLFTAGALLQWAAGVAGGGGVSAAGILAGSAVGAAAAQLVSAVAGLPPSELEALAAAGHCELKSELSLVLAGATEAALRCREAAGGGHGRPDELLCGQLDSVIWACAEAGNALVWLQLPHTPRCAVHCAISLARMVALLGRHQQEEIIKSVGLDASLVAACKEALLFHPSDGPDFVLAGSAFLAVRDAVADSPRLAYTLATSGFLEGLVSWAGVEVRNLKKRTNRHMLLALHPAKLLVSAIAAALLQHAKVGTDSPQFKYWAQFTKLSEKKLRGRWMWEQVAREELLPQLLAWVAVPAC